MSGTTAAGHDGRARRRVVGLLVGVVLVVAPVACTVTVDGPARPTTSTGAGQVEGDPATSGTATTDDIEEGAPMRWDVSRPITAESVGLGDRLAVVDVPRGGTPVELTLPDGTWSTTAEELTVQPRRGYVSAINVFRSLSGARAVHDALTADARVLGLPQQRIDRWLAELPAALEGSRAGGTRVRTGINGSNGDVVTSVQISHEPGPGGDESVRLWYAISPVTPGEGDA